MNKNKKH